MPREALERHIRHLQEEVLILGSMVEQSLIRVMAALKTRNRVEAKQIFDEDMLINEKRFAIENAVLVAIATQQPMAHDLRLMAAFLEIITELERMGDYSKVIAKAVIRLGDSPLEVPLKEFNQMAEVAVSMLHRSLSAFIAENPNEAHAIPEDDQIVDKLYNQVYRILVANMLADPSSIDQANVLMWVAHNLERFADRVTNICERTIFIATGELLEMDTSDEEDNE